MSEKRSLPARVLRGVLIGIGGLLGLVLIVVLAWVASNLFDDRAQPPSPELALPARPAESPMFLALVGLMAPPDQAPVEAGRKVWPQIAAAADAASAPPSPTALARPKGEPLSCRTDDDCARQWLAAGPKLAEQLAPHPLVGERCTAVAAMGGFDEGLPQVLTLTAPAAPYTQNAALCAQWFAAQALLAATAGDRERSLAALAQGRQFGLALVRGSHTLIGNVIAWGAWRWYYAGVAAVAQQQPSWVAALQEHAAALPPEALDPKRWVVTEAAFQRGVLLTLRQTGCGSVNGLFGLAWADTVVCRTGLGLLPEATRQRIDAEWLRALASMNEGVEAGVEKLAAAQASAPPPADGLAWRNTFGQMLLGVTQTSFDAFFARQADLELHRRTLALGLGLATVAPAERAVWLDKQAVPPRVKARLKLEPGALTARPWGAEFSSQPPKYIRVALPG